jgi:hypothetical protein
MVLHLLPIAEPSPAAIEKLQEIRLLPNEPKPRPPGIGEWTSRPDDQTIVHVATRTRFKALRLDPPLVEGLRLPFASYEVGAQFVGMDDCSDMLPVEDIYELGRQGIEWVLTYTYESRRRSI